MPFLLICSRLSTYEDPLDGTGVAYVSGITPALSLVSKLTLCVTMFVGRVGPLFLVLALAQRQVSRPYEYPEEHVMIG